MSAGKGIIFTLFWCRERLQALKLTIGMELFSSTRKYLMRISLMAYIPYQAITWRVIHIVQCNRQFYHTERRAKMAWIMGQLIDNKLA